MANIKADGRQLTYSYDAAGNRTAVTTPEKTTTYAFDALNRLREVTAPGSGKTTYTYDAVGNRARVTYPNGAITTYTYDALNRLTRLENRAGSGSLISAYVYTLAPAGNRIRVVEEHSGREVAYTYDELYRLIQETITGQAGTTTFQYSYDAVGNRLSKNDSTTGLTTYTYDANDRLISEVRPDGSLLHVYDANGNLLSRSDGEDVDAYTYDTEDRLVQAITALGNQSGVVNYGYDPSGIRTSKTTNGVPTTYLVDKNRPYAQVLLESTGGSSVSYVYGDDLISM
ncbi:MAG: hypothetical protein R3202_03515, partial [Candidatus Competibacterales bacterium]|nr:hypothetical protein [Candidatus Competibacterales bacterium]